MNEKSEKLIDAWPACSFESRMVDCFLMLKLHCAITEREASAIKKRIDAIILHRSKADPKMACNRCDIKGTCEFAFDVYNINTEPKIDCLASK